MQYRVDSFCHHMEMIHTGLDKTQGLESTCALGKHEGLSVLIALS